MAQLRRAPESAQPFPEDNPDVSAPPADPGGGAGISDPSGRSGESPRERLQLTESGGSEGGNVAPSPGSNVAPRRPSEPTIQAGQTSGGSPGLQPYQPLPGPSAGSMVVPGIQHGGSGGMFGKLGGLKGGGLGVPLDPTSNEASDPISGLIEMLMKQGLGGQ